MTNTRQFYKTHCRNELRLIQSSRMAHFGDILRSLMNAKHSDIKIFALECGLSDRTIQRNLASPTPVGNAATYRAISAALNMTPKELDAAWMEEVADTAAPATDPDQEKPMITIDSFTDWFAQLPPVKQQAVAAIVQAAQNPPQARPAHPPQCLTPYTPRTPAGNFAFPPRQGYAQ